MGIFDSCWEVFRPQPEEPWILWAQRNLFVFDSAKANKWDHFRSPHVGAPGGPAEAYCDPLVREIDLMWASRLAKTTCCIGFMLFTAHVSPSPMMITSASRDGVQDTISDRFWPMAAEAGVFGRLPREGKRSKRKVRLPGCRINSGWAENARTLADKTAKVLHVNEVDKWRWLGGEAKSEADPVSLAVERTKEWPDRKILVEGTPTIAKKSRIEEGFLRGSRCRYFVPCPKCGKYQRLNWRRDDKARHAQPGMITFDKDPGGRRDPLTAYRTARYVCAYCEDAIGEDPRPWMMRRGVWVPDGCEVDHEGAAALFADVPMGVTHHREDLPPEKRTYRWEGWERAQWIRGGSKVDGEVASYQLSTICSLSGVGWGSVAKKFVESIGKVGGLQNFVNSWLGETWEDRKQTEEWETLGRKLIWNVPQKIVPQECSIITAGIDRQATHLVFDVVAFAPGRKPAVIDYGYPASLADVRAWLLAKYPHQDRGPEVPILQALIDVNYHPTDEDGSTVHAWIAETNRLARQAGLPLEVVACRGSNKPLNAPYRQRFMGEDSHCPGAKLIEVDGDHSQQWLEQLLFGSRLAEAQGEGKPEGEPEIEQPRLRLYQPAALVDHEDYLKQLLNEAAHDDVAKKTKRVQRVWRRLDENIPNDHRDATRYALTAALLATRHGPIANRAQRKLADAPRTAPPRPAAFRRPDGRSFLITERR